MKRCALVAWMALATANGALAQQRPVASGEALNQMITRLALRAIPHEFEDKSKWGHTSERWDGLKISFDGLKIRTKRRKKRVNHGTWRYYRVSLPDAEEHFRIEVDDVRHTEDGRIGFDTRFDAKLRVFARVARWVKGVQLGSFSAEGWAVVRLQVDGRVDVQFDAANFPPDVLFVPEVADAKLTLVDLRLDRVSKLGGEFSQQVGRAAESILQDKITERQQKLKEQINEELQQNQDKLRLSLSEFVASKWSKWMQKPSGQDTSASEGE